MVQRFGDFIKSIKPTPEEQEYESWLGNWTYLSMFIYDNAKMVNERVLLVLIYFECHGKNRFTILKRLVTRYQKLRNIREWSELCQTKF